MVVILVRHFARLIIAAARVVIRQTGIRLRPLLIAKQIDRVVINSEVVGIRTKHIQVFVAMVEGEISTTFKALTVDRFSADGAIGTEVSVLPGSEIDDTGIATCVVLGGRVGDHFNGSDVFRTHSF